MKRAVTRFIAALAVAWVCALSASAIMIPADGVVSLPGTTAEARPELAGTVLEDVIMPFHINTMFPYQRVLTGTLQSRVVREDAAGTLDFYWRLKLDIDTANNYDDGLSYLTIAGFDANFFDADWRSDGAGTVHPESASRLDSIYGPGYVRFNFGGDGLPAGEESCFMFLHTDATAYHLGGNWESGDHDPYMWVRQAGIWGYGSMAVGVFGPGEAKPPPVPDGGATAALLGVAVAMLQGVRRVLPGGRAE